jgi:hypothetical protein
MWRMILTANGARLGGTVAYSALTARALGMKAGIVTAVGKETPLGALDGIPIISIESPHSTTFENIYTDAGRVQYLRAQASSIGFDTVPPLWRNASIIHLAPIANEIDSSLPNDFSPALLGVTPQGWMRGWEADGRVSRSEWLNSESVLQKANAVVISREDVNGDHELIEQMAHQTRMLVVTEGAEGCVLHWNGDRRRFRAPECERSGCDRRGRCVCNGVFYPFVKNARPMGSGALCHTDRFSFRNARWAGGNPHASRNRILFDGSVTGKITLAALKLPRSRSRRL